MKICIVSKLTYLFTMYSGIYKSGFAISSSLDSSDDDDSDDESFSDDDDFSFISLIFSFLVSSCMI